MPGIVILVLNLDDGYPKLIFPQVSRHLKGIGDEMTEACDFFTGRGRNNIEEEVEDP